MSKIRLKNNELIKFDKLTGITKIDEKFYVYFNYATYKFDSELGNVVGEGNSVEEALIEAFKNINKRMVKWANRLDRLTDSLKFDPYQAWYGDPKDKKAERRRIGVSTKSKKSWIAEEDACFEIHDPAPNCPY